MHFRFISLAGSNQQQQIQQRELDSTKSWANRVKSKMWFFKNCYSKVWIFVKQCPTIYLQLMGKYFLLNYLTTTDSPRYWCEPRVEALKFTKMYFSKINHKLSLINRLFWKRRRRERRTKEIRMRKKHLFYLSLVEI